MKRFLLTVTLVALGILVAGWSRHALRSRRQSWQGRPLSFWLKEFDDNRGGAAQAVRQIGAAALPYLCDELRAKDPAWMLQLVAFARKQRLVKVGFTPDAQRRERAIQACRALGPVARPAIPALGEALGHGSGSAVQVLESFGPDAIPALAKALTNAPGCSPPYSTALALGRMGAGAKSAVTNLVWEFEHSTVGPPRVAAARALSNICFELIQTENQFYRPEVACAKAAFIHGLSDPRAYIRRAAVDSLAVFKSHGENAVWRLLPLLADPDQAVRQAATNTLRGLEPETITRAGFTR